MSWFIGPSLFNHFRLGFSARYIRIQCRDRPSWIEIPARWIYLTNQWSEKLEQVLIVQKFQILFILKFSLICKSVIYLFETGNIIGYKFRLRILVIAFYLLSLKKARLFDCSKWDDPWLPSLWFVVFWLEFPLKLRQPSSKSIPLRQLLSGLELRQILSK